MELNGTTNELNYDSNTVLDSGTVHNLNTATLSNERDYNGTVGDTVEGTVGDQTAHSLPNFGAIAKLKVTRRIPKAARFAAAKELTRRITEVVSDQNERSWGNLFAFASSCFNVPAKVKRNGPSLATVIKRNIVKFEREGYTTSTTVPNFSNASKRAKKKDDELLSKMVSAKISSGDIKGAVRILASDCSILPHSHETLQKLREKHPSSPVDLSMPDQPSSSDLQFCYMVTREEIRKSINSFKPGSSPGPDRLTSQHLKDMTGDSLGAAANDLLDALVNLFNDVILSGKMPQEICSIFYGAKLFALSKPDGGTRPIAVGGTLRRIAGKLCVLKLSETIKTKFLPYQVGVGCPSGAEAAIHTMRRYMINNTSSKKVILKIDFHNAFNSVRRDILLQKVKQHDLPLFPFIWQAYSSNSNLYFGADTLKSETGLQQGDVLGSYLFALSIHQMIVCLKSELNIWYLDDGTLAGSYQDVLDDFGKVIEEGSKLGLKINPDKCELIQLDDIPDTKVAQEFRQLAPTIKIVDPKEAELLGAPLLESAGEKWLEEKLNDLKRVMERIRNIDCHDAYFILKNCLSIPKLLYGLRSAPLFKLDAIHEFDKTMRSFLQSLLNIKVSDDTWKQITLPVKLGGLGIRSVGDMAISAYGSSSHKCQPLVELCSVKSDNSGTDISYIVEAEDLWHSRFGFDALQRPKQLDSQGSWDGPVCESILANLIGNSSSETEKARLLAISSEHASDWLNAIPISSLGLKMNNRQFKTACALRLGAEICQKHICNCGTSVNKDGIHGLSCKKSSGRHPRHSQANELIKRALVAGGISAVREPQGVSRKDGKRPDGMTQFPWKGGKCLLWDFSCGDTLAPTYVKKSAGGAGHVATEAEKRKFEHYDHLEKDFVFVPVCVETMGTFGSESQKLIKEIGRNLKAVSGEKRSTAFLFQSIGLAVQRGNAQSVLGTVKDDSDFTHEIYLL